MSVPPAELPTRPLAKIRGNAASPKSVFGSASARDGRVYRMGWSSTAENWSGPWQDIAAWTCGRSVEIEPAWWSTFLRDWLDSGEPISRWSVTDAASSILMVASSPRWRPMVTRPEFDRFLAFVTSVVREAEHRDAMHPGLALLTRVELPLTMHWRLRRGGKTVAPTSPVPRWTDPMNARNDLMALCKHEHFGSHLAALRGECRLAVASLWRSMRLLDAAHCKPVGGGTRTFQEMAHWLILGAMPDGSDAFKSKVRQNEDAAEDALQDRCDGKSGDLERGGLIEKLIAADPEALEPAWRATTGKRNANKLRDAIAMPETLSVDEPAGLAIMRPQWHSRRMRLHLDFARETMRATFYSGGQPILHGDIDTRIVVDDEPIDPVAAWEVTCAYSDDDVHYVEFEQRHRDGLRLQRHWLMIREERVLMMADAVHGVGSRAANTHTDAPPGVVRLQTRLQCGQRVVASPDPSLTEIHLGTPKPRCLLLPLGGGEWKDASAPVQTHVVDGVLETVAVGERAVFAPLWFDLDRKRFDGPRTFRRLTVADRRRICEPHEAVGFRVQRGEDQWVIYRSLGGQRIRTVMGRHLQTDFLLTRFHGDDETFEDLVTVDEE